MDKQTKEYLRQKHQSLNKALQETRDKNLSQLAEMVDNKNKEIDSLENKLKTLTTGFFLLFALTIIAGVALTFLTGLSILVGVAGTTTGFTSELSIYYAMTKDIQIRLNDLRHQRDKIENELITSSKEISKTLIDEQRTITSVLTKEKMSYIKDEDEEKDK